MPSFITPIGFLSYPNLFRPRPGKDGKPGAYDTSILFEADALETPEYKALAAEVLRVGKDRFGDKFAALVKDGKVKLPFRKDVESSGYDATRFVMFVNPRNQVNPNYPRPAIIDRRKNEVTDPSMVFPGVRARGAVTVFAFDRDGNKGVAFGLQATQIIGDKNDPRLDNKTNDSAAFPDLPTDTATGSDLSDMESMLG